MMDPRVLEAMKRIRVSCTSGPPSPIKVLFVGLQECFDSLAEIAGKRSEFHVAARLGGCLDVRISRAEPDHEGCEVKRRTFGAPEEALVVFENFIKLLPRATQANLLAFLQDHLKKERSQNSKNKIAKSKR